MSRLKVQVVVVMGSRSDLGIMKKATALLTQWGVGVETEIVSAHRTPRLLKHSVERWEAKGVQVIIAGAGGAAHLPGMLASMSVLPVIGVPIKSRSMNGLDALLSIAQMPKGVPVASVAVDNSVNAALLAIQILSVQPIEGKKLRQKMIRYRRSMVKEVSRHRHLLKNQGIARFLKNF